MYPLIIQILDLSIEPLVNNSPFGLVFSELALVTKTSHTLV